MSGKAEYKQISSVIITYIEQSEKFMEPHTILVDKYQKQIKEYAKKNKVDIKQLSIYSLIRFITKIKSVMDTLLKYLKELPTTTSLYGTMTNAMNSVPELLEIYMGYCKRYHKYFKTIENDRDSSKEIDTILTDYEKTISDSFEAVLFTPFEHIHQTYKFLAKLNKEAPKSLSSTSSITTSYQLAQSEVTRMAILYEEVDEVNEVIQVSEGIEGIPSNNIGRRLFTVFDCTKFSRKKVEPRTLGLFSDCIIIGERGIGGKLKSEKVYKPGEFRILDVQDQKPFINAIDVLTLDKSFRANLASPEAKTQVLGAFQMALGFYRSEWSKVDQDSYAPVWIPDDLVPECMLCHGKFSFINRRHHCRVCGRCICSGCSQKVALKQFEGKAELVCTHCIVRFNKT